MMVSAGVYGGYVEGTEVLSSLPIVDMAAGALSAITILSMLRDHAKSGGSWAGARAGCAGLIAMQVISLEPWVRLYQKDVVEHIE
jgi:hypothetical protein